MQVGRILLASVAIFGVLSQAQASDIQTDMHWFKSILSFSKMSDKSVEAYLSPYQGPETFRLSEKKAPWAGNYFAMIQGGIAHRWQSNEYPAEVLDREIVEGLSKNDLLKLSPVEKYDILRGDYTFNSTKHELTHRGPLRQLKVEHWEGFCNGVRCAGIVLPEPKFPVEITNREGIRLEFLPADLKALAGASYFYVEKYGQLGGPTNTGTAANQPNAAIFDLALRYHLAKNKKAFVIDTHLGAEIWNETVVGYQRKLHAEQRLTAADKRNFPTAAKKIQVDLILDTLGEVNIDDSNKPTKGRVSSGDMLTTLDASYVLYLDAEGKAVDGKWLKSDSHRGVDFAWFAAGKGMDNKYKDVGGNPFLKFEQIRELFKESATPSCGKLFR